MPADLPPAGVELPAAGRLAYVGADRQVHVVRPDGTAHRQVTFAKVPGPLTSWGATGGQDACSWPCWSPDGRWLACFESPDGEDTVGHAALTVVEVDGVEERQLVVLDGRLPIYAQWDPRGERLALLSQGEDALQLWTCRLDEFGVHRMVERGVPLFFTWAPDGRRLLIHAADPEDGRGRLVLRDGDGDDEVHVFPDPPGSFCTPLFVAGKAVYVTGRGRQSRLCVSGPAGQGARELGAFDGLLAVVPAPLGDWLALAAAPGGEGTPYRGIWLVSLDGAPPRRLIDEDCMAFFWRPDGRALVVAAWDWAARCMWWRRVDVASGRSEPLCRFWPSRDQLFYLHFFEQYAQSHPIVSPDGSTLVFAGLPEPGRGRRTARIVVMNLDGDAKPRELAEGTFAVFPTS